MLYILDDEGFPSRVTDPTEMHTWRRENFARCIVARDAVDDITVSTVFLSTDASGGVGCPILWETVIFRGAANPYHYEQYSSKTDAEAGHLRALELIRTNRAAFDKMVGADE